MAILTACSSQSTAPEASPTPPPIPAALLAAIALPIYPGAVPTEGGGASIISGATRITAAYFRTDDSLDKVENFYVRSLPARSLKDYIPAAGSGAANFVFVRAGVRRQVTLSTDPTGTIISLTMMRPAAKR